MSPIVLFSKGIVHIDLEKNKYMQFRLSSKTISPSFVMFLIITTALQDEEFCRFVQKLLDELLVF